MADKSRANATLYLENCSELTTAVPQALYEPSVIGFKGRDFLTMRAEKTGYVARGIDLGDGFAPVVVNAEETWVNRFENAFPKDRQDENNRVLLAKIHWNTSN